MYAGALVEWLSVALGETACCALKAVQYSVDHGGCNFGGDAGPVVVEYCSGHVRTRRVAHALVQPENLTNKCCIDYVSLAGVCLGSE